jgi:hypothetical protein
MRNRRFIALLALPVLACVEKADFAPYPEQVLDARILASDRDLLPGETTSLTVQITNTLTDPVRLTFPTTCQALLFIRNDKGRVTTPENGTYECASVPSALDILPGETAEYHFEWGGGIEFGPPGTSTRVAPGTYYASAELRAEGHTAIAFPILIVVQ